MGRISSSKQRSRLPQLRLRLLSTILIAVPCVLGGKGCNLFRIRKGCLVAVTRVCFPLGMNGQAGKKCGTTTELSQKTAARKGDLSGAIHSLIGWN